MTTICSVRFNGKTAIAGDGQVTLGEKVIAKATARKIRRIYHDRVVIGFAGGVADEASLKATAVIYVVLLLKWHKIGVKTPLCKN